MIEEVPLIDEASNNKEALLRDRVLNDIHGLIYDFTIEPEKAKKIEAENKTTGEDDE